MEGLINLLKTEILRIVENIDAGNSKMSEEDMTQAIMALQKYSHKDEWLTKYQACQFLNGISRSKFDSLVANGEIPKGQKNFAGDPQFIFRLTNLVKQWMVQLF